MQVTRSQQLSRVWLRDVQRNRLPTQRGGARTARLVHERGHSPGPRERLAVHVVLYSLLVVLLIGSVGLFFARGVGVDGDVWVIYYRYSLVTALVSTWFTFLLLFWGDVRRANYPPYRGQKFTVVIPCYNEDARLLVRSIRSVIRAHGNKDIIVVDDGSTNGCGAVLDKLVRRYPLCVYRFTRNRGKRAALRHGFLQAALDSEYFVVLDSDAVVERTALVRAVEPMADRRVGAATGEIRLLNERRSWLTRMVGAYYWSSLNIDRRAQSALGMVSCCSGCLSAYRAAVIRPVLDEFAAQQFLGSRSTISDDRHLTNLVLRAGYDAVYRPEAVAYTVTPETVRGFVKQQLRWRRGYIKESLWSLPFLWKRKPLLFLDTVLWGLAEPVLSLAFMFLLLLMLAVDIGFLLPVAVSWLVFLLVRRLPVLLEAPRKIPGLVLLMFFYYGVLYWVGLYALLTVRSRRWATR